MTSKHSTALQTLQTCSFAEGCPMLHLKVAFEAPSSCAHCGTATVDDNTLHLCLNQWLKSLLLECLPVVRYCDALTAVQYKYNKQYSRWPNRSMGYNIWHTVGPLCMISLWAKKRVSTGALEALNNPPVVQTKIWRNGRDSVDNTYQLCVFGSDEICQLRSENSNCADSKLAKFDSHQSYGI